MSLMNVYFDLLSPFKTFNKNDFESLSKQLEKIIDLVSPLMKFHNANWTGEKEALTIRMDTLMKCIKTYRIILTTLLMYPYLKISDKQLSRMLYDTSLRIVENIIAIFDDLVLFFSQQVSPTTPLREEIRQSIRVVSECCKKISSHYGQFEVDIERSICINELPQELIAEGQNLIVKHLSMMINLFGNISELMTFYEKAYHLAKGKWNAKDFSKVSQQLKEVILMLEKTSSAPKNSEASPILLSVLASFDRPIKVAINALWLLFTLPSITTAEFQSTLTLCQLINEVFINSIRMLDGSIKCQLGENYSPELISLRKDLSSNFELIRKCCQGIFAINVSKVNQDKSSNFVKESDINDISDDKLKELVKENLKYLKCLSESEVKCSLCGVKLNRAVNSWVCHFRSLCHCSKLKQSQSSKNLHSLVASATFFTDSLALRLPSLEVGQKQRIDQLMNEAKDEINILSLEQDTNKLSFYCNACLRSIPANKVVKHVELKEHQSNLQKIPLTKRQQVENVVPPAAKRGVTVPTPAHKNVVVPTQCNKSVGAPIPTDRTISTPNNVMFQSPDFKRLDSKGQETIRLLVAKLKDEINELSVECRGASEEPYFFCNICKASLRAVFVEIHVNSPYHLKNLPTRRCLNA